MWRSSIAPNETKQIIISQSVKSNKNDLPPNQRDQNLKPQSIIAGGQIWSKWSDYANELVALFGPWANQQQNMSNG